MADQRTSSEEELEGYLSNTIWSTEWRRQYDLPTTLHLNMTGECGPTTIASTQPYYQQLGNQGNLILSPLPRSCSSWNINNSGHQQGQNPQNIYSNNNGWIPNNGLINRNNPQSTVNSSSGSSDQSNHVMRERPHPTPYPYCPATSNSIELFNNSTTNPPTQSECYPSTSVTYPSPHTTCRYPSVESTSASTTTNIFNVTTPYNKGILQDSISQVFLNNGMEGATNATTSYEDYAPPLYTTRPIRATTADIAHLGIQSGPSTAQSTLAIPQGTSYQTQGTSSTHSTTPPQIFENHRSGLSVYPPVPELPPDQVQGNSSAIPPAAKIGQSVVDQSTTSIKTSPESTDSGSGEGTSTSCPEQVAPIIRTYKRRSMPTKKTTKRKRQGSPIELTEEASRYAHAFSQANTLKQSKDQKGIHEAIVALLKNPEPTLEGWKKTLDKSKWKMITGLICRTGTYWETELGCLCVNCVIKQKMLRNNPSYKKRSFHELEAKVWISGYFCNNCYAPVHEIRDAATCPQCIVTYWNTRGALRRGTGSTLGIPLNPQTKPEPTS